MNKIVKLIKQLTLLEWLVIVLIPVSVALNISIIIWVVTVFL